MYGNENNGGTNCNCDIDGNVVEISQINDYQSAMLYTLKKRSNEKRC